MVQFPFWLGTSARYRFSVNIRIQILVPPSSFSDSCETTLLYKLPVYWVRVNQDFSLEQLTHNPGHYVFVKWVIHVCSQLSFLLRKWNAGRLDRFKMTLISKHLKTV